MARSLPDFNDNPSKKKNEPLTAAIVDMYRCNPCISRIIEITAARLKRSPFEMRVLDYGCGRGELVAYLRRLGYRCHGVEVEFHYLKNAAAYFGNEPAEFPAVSLLDAAGRSVFPDGFFDVIVSEQVLEHVKNIDPVVSEIKRLLAPDGVALHVFPSAYSLIEPHMFLPVCHWLPKNSARHALIQGMLSLGLGAPYFKDLTTRDRAEIFFRFSVSDTYYRKGAELAQAFHRNGFSIRGIVKEKLVWRGRRMAKIIALPLIGPLMVWLYATFHQTYLLTAKSRTNLG